MRCFLFIIIFLSFSGIAYAKLSLTVPDFSGFKSSKPISLYEPMNLQDLKNYRHFTITVNNIIQEKNEISKELLELAEELKNSVNLDEEVKHQKIATDVSGTLFSYLVKQFTNDILDVELISSSDNVTLFSGVGLGIKPMPGFAFKMLLEEEEEDYNMGLELKFMPSRSSTIKFRVMEHMDQPHAGLEFMLRF